MKSNKVLSDHELIKLTLSGNQDSYAEIVKRYQSLVKHVCCNLVKNNAIADEICQASFLSAWEKLYSFKYGSFKSWLCRIAYHQAVNFIRCSKNETNYIEKETHYAEQSFGQDSQYTTENAEMQILLNKAMNELSEDQQHVITLVYVVGMTYTEVADAMRIPLSTAKSHGQRAMKKILSTINGKTDAQ